MDGVPAITIAKARPASTITQILKTNLEDEKGAVDFYTIIMKKFAEEKANLPYNFLKLEHDVRHIIMDEMEHISELRRLLAMKLCKEQLLNQLLFPSM